MPPPPGSWVQVYEPHGFPWWLSALIAALPVAVLFYLLGVRRTSAPRAALGGATTAILVAILFTGMPWPMALAAFADGAAFGLFPIGWIVFTAILLYQIAVDTGQFEVMKFSIGRLTGDRRLQALLIAFSFGAIIEGTSGFGTPVAIAGAVMVGLGFSPFQSAVLNLLANTAPVAWGAIGTPIVTLAAVSGLNEVTVSAMAGRQLPFVSVLVPFWLVTTFVLMEGGTLKEAFEVWPATLCSGVSFAVMQWFASSSDSFHLMTDVVAGVFSVVCTALFLRFVWHPKTRFLLRAERPAAPSSAAAPRIAGASWQYPYSVGQTAYAWTPWALLILCCGLWGMPAWKAYLNGLFSGVTFKTSLLGSAFGGSLSLPAWDMPALHNLVQRMPPVAPPNAKPEAARFVINWLSAAGTGVFVAALLSGLVLRLNAAQWARAVGQTLRRMKVPVLVIGQVLGLGFLTRYSGTDAVLGLAFTSAGVLYPFFAAYLGWLGVFLTGSDTASNALFGSLQRITAQQLNLNEVLIVATNSTGGVMGKMIDAQSIMVACAACYDDPKERSHALGPIFRTVWWHSVIGAAVIGLIALLQAYVVPGMIPVPPGK
jgi:lactate permease